MEQTAQQLDMIELEHLTDEEVVELAKYGNVGALEFLINKYKNFVRAKARRYTVLQYLSKIESTVRPSGNFTFTSLTLLH